MIHARDEDTEGRRRVVVERVSPEIDAGRFPVKRTVGERVVVQADVFTDGHDVVAASLLHRAAGETKWTEVPMEPTVNDRWRADFTVRALGRHEYTIEGWIDELGTWRRDLEKRAAAGQDLAIDLEIGARIVERAMNAAQGADQARLRAFVANLRDTRGDSASKVPVALDPEIALLVRRVMPRPLATRYARVLSVDVDRDRAAYGAWYELFPRSTSPDPKRHGTLRDAAARVPYVARLGFDVLYLPPIHPIGVTYRKGPNNGPEAKPGDPGSPWAIGAKSGGHTAIHPDLGTIEDFRHLVATAKKHGLELALDLAFQCSPDHPWVKEHPEWFVHRPDGTIQYAENPPKKYQDIYPFHFETETWKSLWRALKGVVDHWIGEGVRIFRVDNPHTKPFPFWEWLIRETRREHPDVVFLAEAFTRPKVMYELAKLGFSQSYTYFAWRQSKRELVDYMTELTRTEAAEFYRPALWPNTPDILTEQLQLGGRPVFASRLVLAATLGATYGIYGPPFELCVGHAREPGGEEYLDSEKYQVRHWDLAKEDGLQPLIQRINRIRKETPALHRNDTLRFHPVDNEQLLAFTKSTPEGDESVLVVVNLDPHHKHAGWLELDVGQVGVREDQSFQVHDLLTDARFLWRGRRNYVEIDPAEVPAHVFKIRRRVRTEHDFEYFL